MPVAYDASKVCYAHQCEKCGKVIKTLSPAPPPAGRCEYLAGSRRAALAFLVDQWHKFWPPRCEGHAIAGMVLEPLQPMEEPSASAGQYIRCVITGQMLAWNNAVKAGWVLDRKGKPFEAYYSPDGLGTMEAPHG